MNAKLFSLQFVVLLLIAFNVDVANAQTDSTMSFFITSVGPGNGADLGGLEGADQHCQWRYGC